MARQRRQYIGITPHPGSPTAQRSNVFPLVECSIRSSPITFFPIGSRQLDHREFGGRIDDCATSKV